MKVRIASEQVVDVAMPGGGAAMAEERGGHGMTQIIVALIGVVGVIAAALFGNWDKIFGGSTAPAPTAQVAPAPAPPSPTVASSAPVASLEELRLAQENTLNASTDALNSIAKQIENASAPDISGLWHDTDGYDYSIDQKGAEYAFRQLQGGAQVGSGEGRIEGRTLRHQFTAPDSAGACEGEVGSDGRSIWGRCTSGGESWPFRVTR